ncbi:winged helix-turn-helix transcriptional regulator [Nocardioides sp.]|uniref:winged helix-turn-helix transcriptional regulator n=1 Tax=Nocardioides sp. TaxID=35761 RepID=UPI0039E601C0
MPSPTAPPPAAEPNALSIGLGLLGDEWTLFLLRYALRGLTRYSEFSAQLPISHAVLSARLDQLASSGLMERHLYQERPKRYEYVLTPAGRATWPILVAIWGWERAWVKEHEYATPPIRHLACGNEISPVLTCEACHRPVAVTDLETNWGPSGGWPRSTPSTTTRRRSGSRGVAIEQTFYPDTMAVFGNRWSATLVGAAMLGIKRFTDFQDAIGAPPSLLAGRLSLLCERGILAQREQEGRSDWTEYRLTEKGRAFHPVIAMLTRWAEHWFGNPESPVLVSTHVACGRRFQGRLGCDHCHEELKASTIDISET